MSAPTCGTIVPGFRGLVGRSSGLCLLRWRREGGSVGQTALRAAWTMSACVSPLPLVFAERLGADGVTDGTAFWLVRGLGLLQRHLGGTHLGAGHVGYAEGVVPQAIEQGARIECGRFAPRARALPRGFRGGRAGCRLRFAAPGRVTAAPAVSPASWETGRRPATRTPPRFRYPGRASVDRRRGRRSTDSISGPSGLLVMASAPFEGELFTSRGIRSTGRPETCPREGGEGPRSGWPGTTN